MSGRCRKYCMSLSGTLKRQSMSGQHRPDINKSAAVQPISGRYGHVCWECKFEMFKTYNAIGKEIITFDDRYFLTLNKPKDKANITLIVYLGIQTQVLMHYRRIS